MGNSSLLRSPKMEELQEVPYGETQIDIRDELEGILAIEDEGNLADGDGNYLYSQGLKWDFQEWKGFPVNDIVEGGLMIKMGNSSMSFDGESYFNMDRENSNGFVEYYDDDIEKGLCLNLSLNYQEVLDAWSDRGSLRTVDFSLSLANNGYMGEVPVMGEEKRRREASVLRYKEKRQSRLFSKKIRYQVRKLNADKRPRLKGRFVKRVADKIKK
ncbi:hypothetical protein LguiB_000660 [Lonicera macranthoides]